MARAALDRAAELAPQESDTLVALGIFYYRVFHDYDRARKLLTSAIELAPGNTEAWAYLAAAQRRAGDYGEAIAGFQRSLELNPLRSGTAADLAYTFGLAGRLTEANNVLRAARKLDPKTPYLIGAAVTIGVWDHDLNAAWSAANDFDLIDSGAYDFFRSQLALYLRDRSKIQKLVSTWPAPRTNAPYLNYFDLMHVFALRQMGQTGESQILLDQLQQRIEAALGDEPDHDENRKIIIAIYGLQNDAGKLRAAHANLMLNPPSDRNWLVEEGFVVIVAHAVAGERETMFGLIETLMELGSAAQFARVELSPFFDAVRDDARYLALQKEYQQWKKQAT